MGSHLSTALSVTGYIDRLCEFLDGGRPILPHVYPVMCSLKAAKGNTVVPSFVVRIEPPVDRKGDPNREEIALARQTLDALIEELHHPPAKLRTALRKANKKRFVVQLHVKQKGKPQKGFSDVVDVRI